MHRLFLLTALLSASLPALGQTGEAAPDLGASLGQMLFGLGVVTLILFATLWLIKRLSGQHGNPGALKLRGVTALGPRERVVLVEVGDKILVLGVTQHSVNTLHVLDGDALPAPPPPATGGKDFSAWLKQSLERRKHEA